MHPVLSAGWDRLVSQQCLEVLTGPEYTCGCSAILGTLNGEPGLSCTLGAPWLLLCCPLGWSRDLMGRLTWLVA